MESVGKEILSVVADATPRLTHIDERTASLRPAPGKWSKKEIVGHLIDSAANNHQRFVRLQLSPRVELPGYAQDDWVRVQRYQDQPWQQLIALWASYNALLAQVIGFADPTTFENVWRKPDETEVTLEFIITDYVTHMRHHLKQLL
jgi:hypothetical protein